MTRIYPHPDVLLRNWGDPTLYSFDELIQQGIELAEARLQHGILHHPAHGRIGKHRA